MPLSTKSAGSLIRRRQDIVACITLAALFTIMLCATWQRWTHPIVDHGREMNLPVRILAGEKLYTDIRSHYGPFAPYLNAWLYRVFGIKLITLQSSGIVCAVLILAMIYWLARRLMNPLESAIASAFVMLLCVFNISAGNYNIQPYAYAALYGQVFALSTLAWVVSYLGDRRDWRLFWAGVCTGMTTICKPELVVLSAVPSLIAIALACFSARRLLWRTALFFALPLVLISGLTYGVLFLRVPWETLVLENFKLLSTPQMVYFNGHMSGMHDWPHTGLALLGAVGLSLLGVGLGAMIGSLAAKNPRYFFEVPAWRLWVVIVAGLILTGISIYHAQAINIHPLRSAPLMIVVTIGVILWRCWCRRFRSKSLLMLEEVLFIFTVFGLLSIVRVFLNPFTTPLIVVIYFYLLFHVALNWLLPTSAWRTWARKSAIGLSIALFLIMAVGYISISRSHKSFKVCTQRGCFFTLPEFGAPLVEAIQFVRQRTGPQEQVAVLPQGTMINFLASRPYPLREEIIVPGFVTGAEEEEVIIRLDESRASVVMLINFPTPEYLDRGFGVDYNQKLMRWVTERYHLDAMFSIHNNRELQFGDREFFIKAYVRNP
jgi:hypothetical protein